MRGGSSVHDASLAQRLSLSLGVRVSAMTLPQNQVMPVPLGAPRAEAAPGPGGTVTPADSLPG